MALAELPHYPPVVSLIPNTGIQFLDFGFSLSDADGKRNPKAPTAWGYYDPLPGKQGPAAVLPTLLSRGDEQLAPGHEDYAIDVKRLVQFLERAWVPLPMLREEPGYRHYPGPVNWCRAFLLSVPERDVGGNEYRLIIAVDTSLMEAHADEAYLAPSPDDARNGRRFSLPGKSDFYNFFLKQEWVRGWLDELFRAMAEAAERARLGRREYNLSPEEIADRMEGPNAQLARYIAFIDLLSQIDFLPKLTFTDTITPAKQPYIDVDMVLDLGNSRTCGLLIESEPGSGQAAIDRAYRLELRDLSRPEHVYREPFDSRLEFALARFGFDHFSHRSGRADAFVWPTIVRVGPEAVRLAGNRHGSEGRTGMSSPKRYLWDEEPSQQSWRFNGPNIEGDWEGFAAQGVFATLVNDAGKPLHLTIAGEDDLPTLLARYSRSNLVTFALAEMLLQAIVMINAPATRLRRLDRDSPRRLRRIILTMPTALSLSERQLLGERAAAARDLVYLCLNRAQRSQDPAAGAALEWLDGQEPEIKLKWDEASATQVVYLYTQIAHGFSGDARAFFRAVLGSSVENEDAGLLRVATLDIGGGTTDLVITDLKAEGSGGNVTLLPTQRFRESFSLAGDDIVHAVARHFVVGAFKAALGHMIGRDRTDVLVQKLFGGNIAGMGAEEQLRRQQFAIQVAAPVAISLLSEYERFDPLRPPAPQERPLGSFFAPDSQPSASVIEGIERAVREAGAGADFKLLSVSVSVDLEDIDNVVRSLVETMLRALTEVTWHYRADLLLLSGRPSRFPAIRNIIVESGAVPPHRVIAMHDFRVGQWYPFRNQDARISDPKTTAAVGGMICLLAEGYLQNFNFRSDDLHPLSVARYLGKVEANNRLLAQDVYYSDLNLEAPPADAPLPDTAFQFRGPIALGVRQFPNEWWPASLLYIIDYASETDRVALQPKTPLLVRLQRANEPRASRSAARGDTVVNDRLIIERVEIVDGGRYVRPSQLRMRLQTLRNRDGYWLDTGILVDV